MIANYRRSFILGVKVSSRSLVTSVCINNQIRPADFKEEKSNEHHKFQRLSESAWDPNGPLKALHSLNKLRVPWIREGILQEQQCLQQATTKSTLVGQRILDVGCGAGILSEPLSRLGASVVGVDFVEENIAIANSRRSRHPDLDTTFLHGSLCNTDGSFDAVVASEVLEHLSDSERRSFVSDAADRLNRHGSLFVTTLNKTYAAALLAIVVGEYLTRSVPIGTHEWTKMVDINILQQDLRFQHIGMETVACPIDKNLQKILRLMWTKTSEAREELDEMIEQLTAERKAEKLARGETLETVSKPEKLESKTQSDRFSPVSSAGSSPPTSKSHESGEPPAATTRSGGGGATTSGRDASSVGHATVEPSPTDVVGCVERDPSPDELAADSGLACVVCGTFDVKPENDLIECNGCQRIFHQKCHKPPVAELKHDMTNPWTCRRCCLKRPAVQSSGEFHGSETICQSQFQNKSTAPEQSSTAAPVPKKDRPMAKSARSEPAVIPFKRPEQAKQTPQASGSGGSKPMSGLAGLAANLATASSSSVSAASSTSSGGLQLFAPDVVKVNRIRKPLKTPTVATGDRKPR